MPGRPRLDGFGEGRRSRRGRGGDRGPLALLAPLLGDWIAEGRGQPGEATGGFSFTRELQGRVVVRRNRAGYPATPVREAFTHEDLMVVYVEGGRVRAHYFDNEGHVIDYVVSVDESARKVTFLSAARSGAPGFRLSYDLSQRDRAAILFEVAPPGAPGQFKPYTSGTARREVRAR